MTSMYYPHMHDENQIEDLFPQAVVHDGDDNELPDYDPEGRKAGCGAHVQLVAGCDGVCRGSPPTGGRTTPPVDTDMTC